MYRPSRGWSFSSRMRLRRSRYNDVAQDGFQGRGVPPLGIGHGEVHRDLAVIMRARRAAKNPRRVAPRFPGGQRLPTVELILIVIGRVLASRLSRDMLLDEDRQRRGCRRRSGFRCVARAGVRPGHRNGFPSRPGYRRPRRRPGLPSAPARRERSHASGASAPCRTGCAP